MKSKTLIKNALLAQYINNEWQLNKKDISLENGIITSIEDHLYCHEDTAFIDATGSILMPGFVDVHRHLWETGFKGMGVNWTLPEYLHIMLGKIAPNISPEEVYYGTLLGALECLQMGITTVWDWSHIMNTPEHTEAAIKGLRDSGIRALFGYGTPGTSVWEWFYESQKHHPTEAKEVKQKYFSSTQDLVQMALAIRGPEYSTLDVTCHDIDLGRSLEIPITMHMGCGTFGPKYQGIQVLNQENLLGSDLNFAHGNYFTEDDLRLIANSGGSIAMTPEVEMQMGIGFPRLGSILSHSISVGLGADVVTSCSGSMIDQLRMLLQTERALQHATLLEQGEQPQILPLKASQLLELATLGGARVMGFGSQTGSINVGKKADLLLISPNVDLTSTVGGLEGYLMSSFQPSHIKMVMVEGRIQMCEGNSLRHSLSSLRKTLQGFSSHHFEPTPLI